MTRFVVKHSCGDEVAHDIGGPAHTRQWQAQQRAKKPCPDCKTLAWKTDLAVDHATYAALAQEQELPDLQGTDRQVQWAVTLRGQLLDTLPSKLVELNKIAEQRGHPKLEVDADGFMLIRDIVITETSAPWWIENRQHLGQSLCGRHYAQFASAGRRGMVARKLLLWAGGW